MEEIVSQIEALVKTSEPTLQNKIEDGRLKHDIVFVGKTGPQGEQGPQGIPGEKGEKGDRGEQGIGINGTDGKDGKDGEQGPKGEKGDSPEIPDIKDAVKEIFKDSTFQIEKRSIKDFNMDDQRWHGSGSAQSTLIIYADTLTGAVDGVNKVYTSTYPINQAILLTVTESGDGILTYQPGVDFTFSGTTLTMVSPISSGFIDPGAWLSHT